MAQNYELFKTDIDVSLKNARETLASLKKLQADLKGIGGFSTDLSKNFKSLQQTLKTFSTRSTDIFGKDFSKYIKGVSTDFEKLDATITSLFRNLPRKSEPAVIILRKQFNTLRSELSQTENILNTLDKYNTQIGQIQKAMNAPGLPASGMEGLEKKLAEIQAKRQLILDGLKEEGRSVADVEKLYQQQIKDLQKLAGHVKVVSEEQTRAANVQREQNLALKETIKDQERLVKLKEKESESQEKISREEIRIAEIQKRRAALRSQGALGISRGAGQAISDVQRIISQKPTAPAFSAEFLTDMVQRGQDIIKVTADVRKNFHDITAAVNLFGAEGGNAFVALRRAIYGTDEPVGKFGKLLDFAVKQTTSFSKATGVLQQEAQRLAANITRSNGELRTYGDSLRRLGREENVLETEFAGLNTQLSNSVREFKKLESAVARGAFGPKSGQHIRAYIDGVRELDAQFENLESTLKTVYGLDPVNSKTLQHLQEMRQGVSENERAAQEFLVTVNAIDKGGSFVDKLKRGFSNLIAPIRGVKKEVSDTGDEALLLGGSLDEAAKKGGIFKASLDGAAKSASFLGDVLKQAIGTAIGIPLSGIIQQLTDFITLPGRIAINTILAPFRLMSNIIGTISNQITSFVASLPGEFLQANKLVQDFNTTLKQMMSGFDPEKITKALRGANEFIREIIAKTPFELATGQAAFQQLITGGFDPKKWLGPAADAAAAMNKDMGQLIFAMQRLKAGAKGMGVDMLRDFGIPVQQVGVWLDGSTGKMVEANKVLGKSEDELKAAGYAWKQWQFDAAGSLTQTPIEALDILNGYLQQNAIFAGASAARSKTLAGVLSNLKDSVTTLLTALGQPIFQKFTDILSDVYDIVQEVTKAVEPFVTLIGQELANSMQSLWTSITGITGGLDDMGNKTEGAISRIKEIANAIIQFLKPALMVVLALVRGEWPKAWGLVLKAAQDVIRKIADWLKGSGREWFQWGIGLVKEIARGITWAAQTFIKSAVSMIGNTIASFLKPGSPPEKGPLSNIDQWGQGLVKTFADGFKNADMSFLTTITSSIQSALGNLGLDKFKAIRKNVIDIIAGINKTGTINQDLWAKVQQQIGKGNKDLKEYVGLVLQLKQVSKEYQDAEAAGFIPKELQDRLDAAQTAVQLKEEELKLQEQLNQAQSGGGAGGQPPANLKDQLKNDLDMLKKKKEIGLITEKEYLDGVASLRKQYAEQFLQQGDKKSAKEQVDLSNKASKEIFNQDKEFLEKKKKLGLITEAEYLQQLQDLNKQSAEQLLAAGDEGAAKERIAEAENLQKQIEKVQLAEQRKALEKQVEQEKEILRIKYEKGLITEQEYREGLVKIQEGYIDQLLQLGFPVDKEIDKLKSYKDELKKLTDIKIDKPQDILASFGDEITGELQNMMDEIMAEFSSLGTSTWDEFTKTFTTAFDGIKGELYQAIFGVVDPRHPQATDLKARIMGFFKGLWTDLTAKDGPLADMSDFFNRISEGFLSWANGDGKVTFNEVGVVVGQTIKDGIMAAFGFAKSEEGAATGNFLVDMFKTILSVPDAITGLTVEFLKGVFYGAFSSVRADADLLQNIKGFFTDLFSFPDEITGTVLEGIVGLISAIDQKLQELTLKVADFFGFKQALESLYNWVEEVKKPFIELVDWLVGNSLIPDLIAEIVRLFTDLPNQLLNIDLKGQIAALFPSVEDMTQWGSDMIGGLTEGWENAKTELETKASEVTATIRSYFPFSPAEKGPLSQPINWMDYLTGGLPPVVQNMQDQFQSITNLATNMATATKTVFTSMVQDVGQMSGLMVQSVNQAGDRISKGMMEAAKATSNSLQQINDAINHSRLSEPLGSGFGNYGKGQQAPNLSGGIAAAWKRFFERVRAGTSGLPAMQSGHVKVPQTGAALIHKGEMVLPARMAEAVRSVLVNPNTNVSKSSGMNKTLVFEAGAFSGAFPNVKGSKDAKDFMKQLETMVTRGEMKAQVV